MVRYPIGSDRMDPKYTLKHPLNVMVWGCFSFFGRDSLYFLPKNTTMNDVRYLAIIENKILITMEIHHTSIFMHDGAPYHRPKIVSKWLKDNKIICILDRPDNSPDLNPIENIWNPKLKKAITKVWCIDLPKEYCENLIKSMPKRLQKVIDNKGQMTKY